MAFFVRNTVRTFSTILRKTPANQSQISITCCSNQLPICFRNASHTATADVNLNTQPKIEIFKNAEEWKYVERLLPQSTVPSPTPKSEYPSGYKPQTKEAFTHPYYIRRTKNHMVPVYLKLTFRNIKRTTIVKHITGDIWKLNHDITEYVNNCMACNIRTRVNEFTGQIEINGDHVNLVRDYLLSKGF